MTQQPKPIPSLAEVFAVGTVTQEREKLERQLAQRDAERQRLNSPEVTAQSQWALDARMQALQVTDPARYKKAMRARVNGNMEELHELLRQ